MVAKQSRGIQHALTVVVSASACPAMSNTVCMLQHFPGGTARCKLVAAIAAIQVVKCLCQVTCLTYACHQENAHLDDQSTIMSSSYCTLHKLNVRRSVA